MMGRAIGNVTLYDMPESPHARKVRLLAAELGIPHRRDPHVRYLAKNPNGKLPTLVEDDFVCAAVITPMAPLISPIDKQNAVERITSSLES
jgi:Glutathione S-transferase, N-terminal domain